MTYLTIDNTTVGKAIGEILYQADNKELTNVNVTDNAITGCTDALGTFAIETKTANDTLTFTIDNEVFQTFKTGEELIDILEYISDNLRFHRTHDEEMYEAMMDMNE